MSKILPYPFCLRSGASPSGRPEGDTPDLRLPPIFLLPFPSFDNKLQTMLNSTKKKIPIYHRPSLRWILLHTVLFLTLSSISTDAMAQTETFDIITYTPPKDWTRETTPGKVTFTITDSSKKTYCIIGVYASTASSGSAATDFTSEWNDLAVKPFGASANPTTASPVTRDGRTIIFGGSSFTRQGVENTVMLTAFSGFGKVTSVIAVTNSTYWQDDYVKFVDGVIFKETAATSNAAPPANATSKPPPDAGTSSSPKCTKCRGAKRIYCTNCSGTQKERCIFCSGTGKVRGPDFSYVTCNACSAGYRKCHVCKGTGMITCPKCGGSGHE